MVQNKLRAARLARLSTDEKTSLEDARSSMFMRVRRTVPQFTFSLSASFVNTICSVSTGFFRFFSVLYGFWFILAGFRG